MVGFAGKRGVNGAPGGGLPAGAAGDVLVSDGATWSGNPALPFITQTDWAVDSAAGNDSNVGTAASPLQTPEELQRRWQGRTFAAAAAVTVLFTGTFPTKKLTLAGVSFVGDGAGGNTALSVRGTMTLQFSGTIDVFTNVVPATNTRYAITDATANFPAQIRRRLRLTSGASLGAMSGVHPSAGTGATNGLVGQFVLPTATSYSSVTPAAGVTYAIETWATEFQGFDVQLAGAVTLTMSDLNFVSNNAALAVRSYMLVGATQQNGRLFGCRFSGVGVHQLAGFMDWGACQTESTVSIAMGQGRAFGCNYYSITQYVNGAQWVAQQCMHDGAGVGAININVVNGAMLEDINHRGMFGNSAGDALVLVDDGAFYQCTLAAAVLWGGVAPAALNVATAAVRLRTQSSIEWITLPTLVASTPGVSDIIYGGTVAAWAAVAAGVINANNGACAAPKA